MVLSGSVKHYYTALVNDNGMSAEHSLVTDLLRPACDSWPRTHWHCCWITLGNLLHWTLSEIAVTKSVASLGDVDCVAPHARCRRILHSAPRDQSDQKELARI
jgi:hypothetical protein